MTRKTLAQAIKEAALKLGYCFYSGFDYRMNETIVAYPAAWLSPPAIVAVTGRSEGRIRYRIALKLMKPAKKSSEEQKDEIWGQLERDALEMCRAMAGRKGIAAVEIAECAPAEFTMTNHGELSMALKFDVEIPFCNLQKS